MGASRLQQSRWVEPAACPELAEVPSAGNGEAFQMDPVDRVDRLDRVEKTTGLTKMG